MKATIIISSHCKIQLVSKYPPKRLPSKSNQNKISLHQLLSNLESRKWLTKWTSRYLVQKPCRIPLSSMIIKVNLPLNYPCRTNLMKSLYLIWSKNCLGCKHFSLSQRKHIIHATKTQMQPLRLARNLVAQIARVKLWQRKLWSSFQRNLFNSSKLIRNTKSSLILNWRQRAPIWIIWSISWIKWQMIRLLSYRNLLKGFSTPLADCLEVQSFEECQEMARNGK